MLFCQQGFGQETSTRNKFYGGFGYFMSGYQGFNLGEMNTRLKDYGYPEVENGSVTIGGGGHYLLKNWLLGGEGFGLLGGSVENSDYRVVHAGGYGFLNVGYLAYRSPSFMLYPVLGIGGGNLTLYLKDKNLFTESFDTMLENPGRESIIATGGFLLKFSLMANYIFAGVKENEHSGGFVLGVKTGYIYNVSGDNWSLSGSNLNGAPKAGMSGPYVSIVIGGGGIGN